MVLIKCDEYEDPGIDDERRAAVARLRSLPALDRSFASPFDEPEPVDDPDGSLDDAVEDDEDSVLEAVECSRLIN